MNKRILGAIGLLSLINCAASMAALSDNITNAIGHSDRTERYVARDLRRKPAEVLSLLGVKPGMIIADLMSGAGYYTEILTHAVGDNGKVIAHNAPYVLNRFADYMLDEQKGWLSKFKSKQWQKNVELSTDELDALRLPLQLDAALMVLFYHDTVWQNVDRARMNQHIFNSLKPGGAFVIIDHSGKKGSGVQDVKSLHRIEKQVVIDELLKAGFILEVDSNILSQPDDTLDYNVFRDVNTKRDSTDRFVLKFVKPIE